MGLAALLKNFPDVVGPWAALIPDMRYQPALWSSADLAHLRGTQAYSVVMSNIKYITEGCVTHGDWLSSLGVSVGQVMEAHAIITSRSYGLEVFPGDEPSAIPFGPDFLNHNPNTVSWISALRHGPASDPTHVDCLFYLQAFTLSPTRELFNNYGAHSLPSNLAMYGFTGPDTKDELVLVATTDDMFNGKLFPLNHLTRFACPANLTFDMYPSTHLQCPLTLPALVAQQFDPAGYFRLVNRDFVILYPIHEFVCENPYNGPMWRFVERQVRSQNVPMYGDQYMLRLNVMDSAEPHMNHPSLVWMALCALPSFSTVPMIDQFVLEISTCSVNRNSKYIEEFPVSPLVRNLSKKTLLQGCRKYEEDIIGTVEYNLYRWIGYRNIVRRKLSNRVKYRDITSELRYESHSEIMSLLELVVSSNDTVYTDSDGYLDNITRTYPSRSLNNASRMEEIYKYRVQSVLLVVRKCRQPLERAVNSVTFRTLLDSYLDYS